MSEHKRILLVEDSENDAILALAAFEEANLPLEVLRLRDGQEALDFLFRRGTYAGQDGGPPSVVLLDLKLPKIDGLEVLEQIKADDELKVIPVVMLTSSREESDIVRSYSLGVNAYVVKPVEYGQFVTAIKELGLFWAVVNEPPPGMLVRGLG